MPRLRLIGAFLISLVAVVGCVWVILAPTNQSTTNAAIAILSAIATGWVSYIIGYKIP